jgi:hypothetical protein
MPAGAQSAAAGMVPPDPAKKGPHQSGQASPFPSSRTMARRPRIALLARCLAQPGERSRADSGRHVCRCIAV